MKTRLQIFSLWVICVIFSFNLTAQTNPVVWWNFDETSGTTATDASGNGNEGTLMNMAGTEWTAGKGSNDLTARVVATQFATDDIVIAEYVVTDSPYNADNTGANDATSAIQNAINDCHMTGGGTVWLPAGKYNVTSSIYVKPFVTLRGDWRDPDTTGSSYGTVIMANVSSSTNSTPGLFRIGGSAGCMGLTVYYPSQSASSPVPYPYTFEIPGNVSLEGIPGVQNYMMQSVINCTMLNSYKGIGATSQVHEMANISNVKGTVLYRGMEMYNSAEVGVIEKVKFNNSYWANAGSEFNAPSRSTLDTWTRANGIGFVAGDLEWDQWIDLEFSDYSIGLKTVAGTRAALGAQIFNLKALNCNKGLEANVLFTQSWGGLRIHNSTFQGNQGASPIPVDIRCSGIVSITYSAFKGTGTYGISNTTGTVNCYNSAFENWSSSNFKNGTVGYDGYTVFNTTLPTPPQNGVTSYPWKSSLPKPPNSNFYDASKSPYNADKTGTNDATSAIQSALNAASGAGGGTVYLPAGRYKISTHLTVPANVELRGSSSIPQRDQRGLSIGTILCAYEGHDTTTPDKDTALITLNGTNAGVRGLRIWHPNNNPLNGIKRYPYAIRGNGSGVYVINTGLVNSYNGIDFKTNRCDNHYIKRVVACAFKKGIVIGASTGGRVEGCLQNGTVCCRTGFSGWVTEAHVFDPVINYTKANLAWITVDGASNQHLLNNFSYGAGATTAFVYSNGCTAVAINTAADGNGVGKTINAGTNVKIINWLALQGALVAVTFDARDGTAPHPASKSVTFGSTYGTLATTTRTGYTFAGWWSGTGGTGSEITAASPVTNAANHTLYAKWIANTNSTYAVTYNGNGNTGGTVPASQTKIENTPLTLQSNSGNLAKTGFAFAGWNTAANGSGTDYAAGASYTVNAAVTLYAKWVAVSGNGIVATGGTVTESGGYRIHTFTGNGTFNVTSGGNVEVLVVGGGGGGGTNRGGGGGAGGFVTNTISIPAPESIIVVVGAGGAAGSSGQASSFGSYMTAAGGGGGGVTFQPGKEGASGGGGGLQQDNPPTYGQPGGSGTSGQGFAGGRGSLQSGGGGGGAGAAGAVPVDAVGGGANGQIGGAGGVGKSSSITGSVVFYAGGGGGGGFNTTGVSDNGGAGGQGGGGRGASGLGANTIAPSAGITNTGGGGGGGTDPTNIAGAAGGSGIVIVRYLISTTTDINNTELVKDIIVYPNPTIGLVHVNFSQIPERNTTIRIFNNVGQMIVNKEALSLINQIDLSGYPSGIYTVVAGNTATTVFKK